MAEVIPEDEDLQNASINIRNAVLHLQSSSENEFLESPHLLQLAYYSLRRVYNSTKNEGIKSKLGAILPTLRGDYDGIRRGEAEKVINAGVTTAAYLKFINDTIRDLELVNNEYIFPLIKKPS